MAGCSSPVATCSHTIARLLSSATVVYVVTDDGLDAEVSDRLVAEMVTAIDPAWSVAAVDRIAEGTEFVARVELRTSDRRQTAVLKATTANLVEPPVARAEPRLLSLVGEETDVPVPDVLGVCERHPDLPAPIVLLEHVDGETYENRIDELTAPQRERICRDAGRNLAHLHERGPLPAAGGIGVPDDELTVIGLDDIADEEAFDDGRDWLLESVSDTLDALETGGWFPDLADDPERFADLVPEVRSFVADAIPALPQPDPPTYCHTDYRYGNLLVDPDTGATNAVLDWANLSAAPPSYNLANAESLLFTPDRDPPERTATLGEAFRSAYAEERTDWRFDAGTEEWLAMGHLASRLAAMACLPLWYRDATPAERDERAVQHRAFVREYL